MTLNLAEADAVNNVITHLTGRHTHATSRDMPTRDQAVDALTVLAQGAYKRLHAGYDGDRARAALTAEWQQNPTDVVVDETTAEAAEAYRYLRPFLGLSDLLPDGTPQDAPVRIGPLRAILAERGAVTTRAEAAETAFEQLHARINRDFNFDAAECACPEDEYWARLMDDLVTFASELSETLEAISPSGAGTHKPQHAPHTVTVTHLDSGFDQTDQQPHELLLADHGGGWVSHRVQHPAACNLLPYGQQCWFDDEWNNGQFTYDDIAPGLYRVTPGHQDVGDHRGEFSHTEDYLDYRRIGDAPERPAPQPPAAVHSEEPPF